MMNSTWETLQVFAVQAVNDSTQLYANGRQQAKLLVKVQAVDASGQPAPLSLRELDSLRLIEYNGNQVIADDTTPYELRELDPGAFAQYQYDPIEYDRLREERAPYDPKRHDLLQYNKHSGIQDQVTWVWGATHNADYRYFPVPDRDKPDVIDQGGSSLHVYYCDLYVRTISSTPLRIALQLTRDGDGKPFRSNDPDMQNGSITLKPVVPERYKSADYSFARITVSGDVTSQLNFDSVDYYPFGLNVNNVAVKFLRFSMSPRSLVRYAVAPKERGSVTGYTNATDRYLRYGFSSNQLFHLLDAGYGDDSNPVVALIRSHHIVHNVDVPGQDFTDQSSAVRALDVYGNEHEVRVRFKGEGRNYLELI